MISTTHHGINCLSNPSTRQQRVLVCHIFVTSRHIFTVNSASTTQIAVNLNCISVNLNLSLTLNQLVVNPPTANTLTTNKLNVVRITGDLSAVNLRLKFYHFAVRNHARQNHKGSMKKTKQRRRKDSART